MTILDLKKLKQIRKIQDKTQEDCAIAIGVTRAEYTRKEAGKTPISFDQIESLGKFFDVPVISFFNINIPANKVSEVDAEMIQLLKDHIKSLKQTNKMLTERNAELEKLLKSNGGNGKKINP